MENEEMHQKNLPSIGLSERTSRNFYEIFSLQSKEVVSPSADNTKGSSKMLSEISYGEVCDDYFKDFENIISDELVTDKIFHSQENSLKENISLQSLNSHSNFENTNGSSLSSDINSLSQIDEFRHRNFRCESETNSSSQTDFRHHNLSNESNTNLPKLNDSSGSCPRENEYNYINEYLPTSCSSRVTKVATDYLSEKLINSGKLITCKTEALIHDLSKSQDEVLSLLPSLPKMTAKLKESRNECVSLNVANTLHGQEIKNETETISVGKDYTTSATKLNDNILLSVENDNLKTSTKLELKKNTLFTTKLEEHENGSLMMLDGNDALKDMTKLEEENEDLFLTDRNDDHKNASFLEGENLSTAILNKTEELGVGVEEGVESETTEVANRNDELKNVSVLEEDKNESIVCSRNDHRKMSVNLKDKNKSLLMSNTNDNLKSITKLEEVESEDSLFLNKNDDFKDFISLEKEKGVSSGISNRNNDLKNTYRLEGSEKESSLMSNRNDELKNTISLEEVAKEESLFLQRNDIKKINNSEKSKNESAVMYSRNDSLINQYKLKDDGSKVMMSTRIDDFKKSVGLEDDKNENSLMSTTNNDLKITPDSEEVKNKDSVLVHRNDDLPIANNLEENKNKNAVIPIQNDHLTNAYELEEIEIEDSLFVLRTDNDDNRSYTNKLVENKTETTCNRNTNLISADKLENKNDSTLITNGSSDLKTANNLGNDKSESAMMCNSTDDCKSATKLKEVENETSLSTDKNDDLVNEDENERIAIANKTDIVKNADILKENESERSLISDRNYLKNMFSDGNGNLKETTTFEENEGESKALLLNDKTKIMGISDEAKNIKKLQVTPRLKEQNSVLVDKTFKSKVKSELKKQKKGKQSASSCKNKAKNLTKEKTVGIKDTVISKEGKLGLTERKMETEEITLNKSCKNKVASKLKKKEREENKTLSNENETPKLSSQLNEENVTLSNENGCTGANNSRENEIEAKATLYKKIHEFTMTTELKEIEKGEEKTLHSNSELETTAKLKQVDKDNITCNRNDANPNLGTTVENLTLTDGNLKEKGKENNIFYQNDTQNVTALSKEAEENITLSAQSNKPEAMGQEEDDTENTSYKSDVLKMTIQLKKETEKEDNLGTVDDDDDKLEKTTKLSEVEIKNTNLSEQNILTHGFNSKAVVDSNFPNKNVSKNKENERDRSSERNNDDKPLTRNSIIKKKFKKKVIFVDKVRNVIDITKDLSKSKCDDSKRESCNNDVKLEVNCKTESEFNCDGQIINDSEQKESAEIEKIANSFSKRRNVMKTNSLNTECLETEPLNSVLRFPSKESQDLKDDTSDNPRLFKKESYAQKRKGSAAASRSKNSIDKGELMKIKSKNKRSKSDQVKGGKEDLKGSVQIRNKLSRNKTLSESKRNVRIQTNKKKCVNLKNKSSSELYESNEKKIEHSNPSGGREKQNTISPTQNEDINVDVNSTDSSKSISNIKENNEMLDTHVSEPLKTVTSEEFKEKVVSEFVDSSDVAKSSQKGSDDLYFTPSKPEETNVNNILCDPSTKSYPNERNPDDIKPLGLKDMESSEVSTNDCSNKILDLNHIQRVRRQPLFKSAVRTQIVREQCCGHWFPNTKRFIRHLIDNANTENESIHVAKLLDLGMQKCYLCSVWINIKLLKQHLKKSHNIMKPSSSNIESLEENVEATVVNIHSQVAETHNETLSTSSVNCHKNSSVPTYEPSEKPCPKSKKKGYTNLKPEFIRCYIDDNQDSFISISSLDELSSFFKPSVLMKKWDPFILQNIVNKKNKSNNLNKVISSLNVKSETKNGLSSQSNEELSNNTVNSNVVCPKNSKNKVGEVDDKAKVLNSKKLKGRSKFPSSLSHDNVVNICKKPFGTELRKVNKVSVSKYNSGKGRNTLSKVNGLNIRNSSFGRLKFGRCRGRGRGRRRGRPPKRRYKYSSDTSDEVSESSDSLSDIFERDFYSKSDSDFNGKEEIIPTVELDLFTLSTFNDSMSVLLIDPINPKFKVFASMDAIFVGDSALEDVTNHCGYVSDANNVVYLNPSHFLFPEVKGSKHLPGFKSKNKKNRLVNEKDDQPVNKKKDTLSHKTAEDKENKLCESILKESSKDKKTLPIKPTIKISKEVSLPLLNTSKFPDPTSTKTETINEKNLDDVEYTVPKTKDNINHTEPKPNSCTTITINSNNFNKLGSDALEYKKEVDEPCISHNKIIIKASMKGENHTEKKFIPTKDVKSIITPTPLGKSPTTTVSHQEPASIKEQPSIISSYQDHTIIKTLPLSSVSSSKLTSETKNSFKILADSKNPVLPNDIDFTNIETIDIADFELEKIIPKVNSLCSNLYKDSTIEPFYSNYINDSPQKRIDSELNSVKFEASEYGGMAKVAVKIKDTLKTPEVADLLKMDELSAEPDGLDKASVTDSSRITNVLSSSKLAKDVVDDSLKPTKMSVADALKPEDFLVDSTKLSDVSEDNLGLCNSSSKISSLVDKSQNSNFVGTSTDALKPVKLPNESQVVISSAKISYCEEITEGICLEDMFQFSSNDILNSDCIPVTKESENDLDYLKLPQTSKNLELNETSEKHKTFVNCAESSDLSFKKEIQSDVSSCYNDLKTSAPDAERPTKEKITNNFTDLVTDHKANFDNSDKIKPKNISSKKKMTLQPLIDVKGLDDHSDFQANAPASNNILKAKSYSRDLDDIVKGTSLWSTPLLFVKDLKHNIDRIAETVKSEPFNELCSSPFKEETEVTPNSIMSSTELSSAVTSTDAVPKVKSNQTHDQVTHSPPQDSDALKKKKVPRVNRKNLTEYRAASTCPASNVNIKKDLDTKHQKAKKKRKIDGLHDSQPSINSKSLCESICTEKSKEHTITKPTVIPPKLQDSSTCEVSSGSQDLHLEKSEKLPVKRILVKDFSIHEAFIKKENPTVEKRTRRKKSKKHVNQSGETKNIKHYLFPVNSKATEQIHSIKSETESEKQKVCIKTEKDDSESRSDVLQSNFSQECKSENFYNQSNALDSLPDNKPDILKPLVVKHFETLDTISKPKAKKHKHSRTHKNKNYDNHQHENQRSNMVNKDSLYDVKQHNYKSTRDKKNTYLSSSSSIKPVNVTNDSRQWQSRESKLKAKVMITDHQKGIDNSFVKVESKYNHAEDASNPSPHLNRKSCPNKDIRSYFTQKSTTCKQEQKTSLSSPPPPFTVRTKLSDSSPKTDEFIGDKSTFVSKEHPVTYKHRRKSCFASSKRKCSESMDIRQYFSESEKWNEYINNESKRPRIDVKIESDTDETNNNFEGFVSSSSKVSSRRSKVLHKYVDVLCTNTWFDFDRFPLPVDQLCDWDDEQLNLMLFEKG